MNFPLIRVELEGMKHTVMHAFHNSNIALEEQLKEALAAALDPKHIQTLLNNAAD